MGGVRAEKLRLIHERLTFEFWAIHGLPPSLKFTSVFAKGSLCCVQLIIRRDGTIDLLGLRVGSLSVSYVLGSHDNSSACLDYR